MSLISFTPLADGVTAVNAAATNTPLSTIYNDYNGNITDANVAANAAIAGSKINLASVSNPYKFSVYRNAGASIQTSATIVTFDTKLFDTGTNYATGTGLFTAPVAGFYYFSTATTFGTSNGGVNNGSIYLFKNGSNVNTLKTWEGTAVTGTLCESGSALLQLAANDTIGVYAQNTISTSFSTGSTATWFMGFLLSAT